VKVWWKDGGANLGGNVRKGDLGPPFKGSDTGKFGPEFAFGQVLGDFYPSNNVLIIKCAWPIFNTPKFESLIFNGLPTLEISSGTTFS